MAKAISVNEILAEAQAAKDMSDEAKERVKNIKKVATTLRDAGLLEEDTVEKINEIFPTRSRKTDDDAEDGDDEGNDDAE